MKDGVRYFEREKCIACGRCTDRCYAEALTMMGKTYTPEEVLPYVDLFLYDLKCMDDEAHVKAVGVHNQLIKENIKKLSDAGILPALYGCWKECKMLRF